MRENAINHIKVLKFFGLSLLLTVVLGVSGCDNNKYLRHSGMVWGTTYNITYCSDRDMTDSIINQFRTVEKVFSMFDSTSVVSRFNRGECVIADDDFVRVMDMCRKVNEKSGGLYDPTVCGIVNIWGFGTSDVPDDYEPSPAEIDSALAGVGIAKIIIDENRNLIRNHPHTKLDFSSIAKGFGVDCIARMFERNDIKDYLIEIGGEIYCNGHNMSGSDWTIQIDAPVEQEYDGNSAIEHQRLSVIKVTGCGIATSGNYRNWRLSGGDRVGHTLSPLTGRPIRTDVLSATVVSANCMEADALATACMTMAADQALEMIEGVEGSEVLLTVSYGDSLVMRKSNGFPTLNK